MLRTLIKLTMKNICRFKCSDGSVGSVISRLLEEHDDDIDGPTLLFMRSYSSITNASARGQDSTSFIHRASGSFALRLKLETEQKSTSACKNCTLSYAVFGKRFVCI